MSNPPAFQWLSKPAAEQGQESLLVNNFPGGYWKYGLVDHVLLVNLYFPPKTFFQDLSARLPDLLCCYPSPHWQLAEQTGKVIGQDPDRLVIGNGVTELISILIGRLGLSVAVPTPSFNPYEQAAQPGQLLRFELPPPHFELDMDAFAQEVLDSSVDAAVVISPNNPTSRAMPRDGLLRLAERLAEHDRLLVLDESFVEFMPEGRAASLESEVGRLQNLIIFKSLGKIYGVCGLRIGYMLSSNIDLVNQVREGLSAWNVNTLGEYFLSRLPEFTEAAERSWRLARRDRDQLFEGLKGIPDMQVLPPHANFVFCRLPPHWPDGPELVDRLLKKHSILIRHNGGKTIRDGVRYLRIAARSVDENQRLIGCLQEVADAPGARD